MSLQLWVGINIWWATSDDVLHIRATTCYAKYQSYFKHRSRNSSWNRGFPCHHIINYFIYHTKMAGFSFEFIFERAIFDSFFNWFSLYGSLSEKHFYSSFWAESSAVHHYQSLHTSLCTTSQFSQRHCFTVWNISHLWSSCFRTLVNLFLSAPPFIK